MTARARARACDAVNVPASSARVSNADPRSPFRKSESPGPQLAPDYPSERTSDGQMRGEQSESESRSDPRSPWKLKDPKRSRRLAISRSPFDVMKVIRCNDQLCGWFMIRVRLVYRKRRVPSTIRARRLRRTRVRSWKCVSTFALRSDLVRRPAVLNE